MFKRIRENEKYQKLKELWNDPKAHSLIVLGFWLVFIVIVIAFVRSNYSYKPVDSEVNTNIGDFASVKNYDFTYQTSDLLISGQQYGAKQVFYLNNHRYYYNGNVYIIDNEAKIQNDFDLNVLKINHLMLNNLLSGLSYSSLDGYRQYVVPLDRFINLYEIDTDADLSKAMSYNVVVNVYNSDNTIKKVAIDLTNYRLFKTGNNTNYLLNIYYYNINKVYDFSLEFDKMIGVVE